MPSASLAQPSYRLFFALKPHPLVARQTDHFAERRAAGAHRVRTDHQHMTLAILNDYDDYPYELAKALLRVGSAIAADPFGLHLGRLLGSNRSVALKPERKIMPLGQLQQQLQAGMAAHRTPLRRDWRFSPHQTLFYRDGAPFEEAVDGFAWDVEEFVLICSHVGRTRHDILGKWPLRGSAQYRLF
jgi:2'-5' RNA ligase